MMIFQSKIEYNPGDHVGIIACNRKELVDSLLARLKDVSDYNEPVQLQLMKETHTSSGKYCYIFISSIICFQCKKFLRYLYN